MLSLLEMTVSRRCTVSWLQHARGKELGVYLRISISMSVGEMSARHSRWTSDHALLIMVCRSPMWVSSSLHLSFL